jgi:hypothetical protein
MCISIRSDENLVIKAMYIVDYRNVRITYIHADVIFAELAKRIQL